MLETEQLFTALYCTRRYQQKAFYNPPYTCNSTHKITFLLITLKTSQWSWQTQEPAFPWNLGCSCNTAASLSKWPTIGSLTISGVCLGLSFASPLCYLEAFFSATFPAFVVLADLNLFLLISYTVARGNRERRKRKLLLVSSCF